MSKIKSDDSDQLFMLRHKMWLDTKKDEVYFIAEMPENLIRQQMRKEIEGSAYYILFEEELAYRATKTK